MVARRCKVLANSMLVLMASDPVSGLIP